MNACDDSGCSAPIERRKYKRKRSDMLMGAAHSMQTVAEDLCIDETAAKKRPCFRLELPLQKCNKCGAIMWKEEKVKGIKKEETRYGICCGDGAIVLPLFKEAPKRLNDLMECSALDPVAKRFRQHIRLFNSMFAMTSHGAKIDSSLMDGKGPYTFRMHGRNYHAIGTLLPDKENRPKYAQLYVYDTDNEIDNRYAILNNSKEMTETEKLMDKYIIEELRKVFDENNRYVKYFRKARDWYENNKDTEFSLRLLDNRISAGKSYNGPETSEIAALIIGHEFESADKRDIIVYHKAKLLQRISEMHPSYMPLQYPILFPHGEDGWHRNLRSLVAGNKKRGAVTMREFFAFHLQQRENNSSNILKGGRLFQELIVDAYGAIEEQRLRWIRKNQAHLRSDLYQGLCDALHAGDVNTSSVGNKIILPSSFTGGPRYMLQNYQDAMAICSWAGIPDLFITFTCNPAWCEFDDFLSMIVGQKVGDRPDIVARLFHVKYNLILDELTKKGAFGTVIAYLSVIEFQKRGLPHAHIVITLNERSKLKTMKKIDDIISAELPSQDADLDLHDLVKKHMIHGPCGNYNPSAPCMRNGKCSKGFPKSYNDFTRIDSKGFPIYRRRISAPSTVIKDVLIDSSWVIPYNPFLLQKFRSHINVEVCTHSKMIKYLFKYVHKGPDRGTALVREHNKNKNDEIKYYLDTRYVSAAEAAWRIFEFGLHKRFPPVERLKYHLPNEQQVCFYENGSVRHLVLSERASRTMLTEWFAANRIYPEAKSLLYTEFPDLFVWDRQNLIWKPRKRNFSIGRLPYAQPIAGERYYLRMLLNVVKGATSFESLRTVNGVVEPTFKAACASLGMLDDDNEWILAINEASSWSTAAELRLLFATILLYCEVSNPEKIWQEKWKVMADDYQYLINKRDSSTYIELSNEELQNQALIDIDQILLHNGQSLRNYPPMPIPNKCTDIGIHNQLICDELNYDSKALAIELHELEASLNIEQREAYSAILNSCEKQLSELFFVYGGGGTGKTYLWTALIAYLRSKKKIVLAVASSGIASLLLPGGRTAHSKFKIPINVTEFSTCTIKRQSDLAKLIQQTSLIIWDEAPMTIRYAFDAVDRTFRDLAACDSVNTFMHRPFGGKTVVLGGDFRQILPVVARGSREDIVAASLHRSPLWKHCKLFLLKKNMRLDALSSNSLLYSETEHFAKWILDIGNGNIKGIETNDGSETTWIPIPEDLIIEQSLGLDGLIHAIYPNIDANFNDPLYLKQRAILAPTNEQVSAINDRILSFLPGKLYTYLSADVRVSSSSRIDENDLLYTPEFLNSLTASGLPDHSLKLKVGVPVILLRNISQSSGLCNGTRLIITKLAVRVIEGSIITGSHIGCNVAIPRIRMFADKTEFPFVMRRTQFPIRLAFAMTINKSQGQTLQHVGLFLRTPVFSHGQLYVAVSRATSRQSLKFLLGAQTDMPSNYTANIVYKEVLQAVMKQLAVQTSTAPRLPSLDKGKGIQEEQPRQGIHGDDATIHNEDLIKQTHDSDDLTITQMAMLAKNVKQPKTPLKVSSAPKRPIGIVLEKQKLSGDSLTLRDKGKKHKHRKREKPIDCVLKSTPAVHDTIADFDQNVDTQIVPLTNFDEMTIPGNSYNTHLRVIRLCCGMLYGSDSLPSVAFLALDSNAQRREVVIPAVHTPKWRDKIYEGEAYAVTGISVNVAGQLSRLVDAPYQLTFTDWTELKRLSDSDVPQNPAYTFTKINKIPSLLLNENIVRDIVAFVVDVRPPLTRLKGNKISKFAEVYITDDTIFPRCSVITVWEEHFSGNSILTDGFTKQFVIIGTGLKPNEFRGRYGFQTCAFTRFVYEPENEPAARMLVKNVTQAAMRFNATTSCPPNFSDLYYKQELQVSTVEQFLEIAQHPPPHGQQTTYIVRAAISRICTEMQITYRSCALCSKGMPNPENDSHGCPSNRCTNTAGKTTQRYKIRLEARGNASTITLTLFDKPAQDLLHIQATELEHLKLKPDGFSKLQNLFSKIIHRTCNFYIRYDDDAFRYGRRGSGNYTANNVDWFPRVFTPVKASAFLRLAPGTTSTQAAEQSPSDCSVSSSSSSS